MVAPEARRDGCLEGTSATCLGIPVSTINPRPQLISKTEKNLRSVKPNR